MEILHPVQDGESPREAEPAVADRRSNDWRDPKFIVQILLLLGAILSFYLLSERRTTTLEIAASNLNEKASRIEGQLGAIVASVQTVTNDSVKQKTEIETLKESVRELKGNIGELKAHIDVLRSGQAKLDARTERMR